MALHCLLLLVGGLMVHSSSASYHVLVADKQSEVSEPQDSFWSQTRSRRSLVDPEDILNSLVDEEEMGSGSDGDISFSREQSLQFFVKNANTEHSARTTMSDVMPGDAILTDFSIHNEGKSYKYNNKKAMEKEEAMHEYESWTQAGHSAILVGDVQTVNSRCTDCRVRTSEDSSSVTAVINVGPGDVLSVSLTYVVPLNPNSIEYMKDLYQTNAVIDVENYAADFSGVIMSPNYPDSYPNNADTTWLIKVPANEMVVSASLISFQSESCCDHLYIYDGATDSSAVLAVVSGQRYSTDPFVTTGSSMLLKFQTDCLVNEGGFSLQFATLSSSTVVDQDKQPSNRTFDIHKNDGAVYSPGYPVSYPPSSVLTWTITSDPGTFLTLDVIDVEVFGGESLSIYDDLSGDVITTLPRESMATSLSVKSSGNKVLITFTTNQLILPRRGFYVTFQSQALSNPCTYHISVASGDYSVKTLTSPNYPNNYGNNQYCTWIISVPGDNLVRIEIETLNLESGFDTLQIFDSNGTFSLNNPIATLSGSGGKKIEYVTTGNVATFLFTTDDSRTGSGFEIKYRNYPVWNECNSPIQEIQSPEGLITSPQYPSYDYSTGNCQFLITVPYDKVVNIYLDRVEIDYYYYSNLTFYDGASISDAVLWSNYYANFYDAITFQSSSSQVLVYVNNPYWSYFIFAFRFKEDSENVWSTCGGTLTESPGVIKSPNYPRYCTNGTYCEWTIQAPVDEYVALYIEQLNYDYYSYNFITVYDGNSASGSVLAQCPYNCYQGNSIISSSNFIFITASVSSFDVYFKLKYVFLPDAGSALLTETDNYSGFAISPNFPSNYPNSYSHVYYINVPSGFIEFFFPYFQTESYSDYLRVYDGRTTFSPLIVYLGGSWGGYSGQTSGNSLTMTFQTDGSVTGQGFFMNYCANGHCSSLDESGLIVNTAYSYLYWMPDYSYHYGYYTPDVVLSPGSLGTYPDNVDFYWYTDCGGAYGIQYELNRIDIDSTDFLKFYEDFGTDSLKLHGTLTGINNYYSSRYVYVYGGTSTMWFHSDSAFTGEGFHSQFYCSY